MIKTIKIVACLLFPSMAIAQPAECNNTCKQNAVETYLNNIVEIFEYGSTAADIDNFLAPLHEEIKYEHKEYGADFDKDKWRKAFIRQLERGFYSETKPMQGKILNIIYGKNHAAVEYSYGTIDEKGAWVKDHVKFALFGFKNGKVSLVREYW